MELINIEQVKPGEIVAAPVKNASGAILCPEGYVLTEQAIARMKNAGVESVLVEQSLDNGPEIDARLELLDMRFADVDDAVLLQLKAILVKQLNALRL